MTEDELVKKHAGWIYKTALKHCQNPDDLDDAIQVGNLALIEASRKFDPSKGVKFLSYAGYYIQGALIKAHHAKPLIPVSNRVVRKTQEPAGVFPLEEGFGIQDECDDPLEALLRSEAGAQVREALNKIPALQAKVLQLFFGISGSGGVVCAALDRNQISIILKKSPTHIDLIKSKGLENLKKKLHII